MAVARSRLRMIALLLGSSLAATSRQASLATWNLLAPKYASRTKYPWVSEQALSWTTRRDAILRQLATMDADMVCLQEVENALWDDLHLELQALGYDGELQAARGHPVSTALLFKRDRLVCVRTESRSRAMIAVAKAAPGVANEGVPLYVASVHLEAGPQKEDQRTSQMASLLKRLRLQADMDGVGEADVPPVVIAGDFNCDRRAPLHAALSTGMSSRPGRGELSPNNHLMPASAATLLPLRDAYGEASPPWGPELRSTYRNGRVLDYIFTSSGVEVHAHSPSGGSPTALAITHRPPSRFGACALAGPAHDARQHNRRLVQPAPAAVRSAPVGSPACGCAAALAGRASCAAQPALCVAAAGSGVGDRAKLARRHLH